MNKLYAFILYFISLSTVASASTHYLTCVGAESGRGDYVISVEIQLIDQNQYTVMLKNQYGAMPVLYQHLTFNENSELISIETSAQVELFQIRKTNSRWRGEYWFDNFYFPIQCTELN